MTLRPDSTLVTRVHASPNIEPRRADVAPSILLLHYTGLLDVEKAIDWLSRPESKVSCHYVVTAEGLVVQMVAERDRAWHAGLSCWHGESDINSASIGIEIDNPGHESGSPPFPPRQMQAVLELCRDIGARHAIRPECVLAHSDVAPQRKIDPGEQFDWRWLAANGIGHWVEPEPACPGDVASTPVATETIMRMQRMLAAYGYDIRTDGVLEAPERKVISAFQRHFRPARVDGVIDASSLVTLERLLAALPAGSAT